MPGCALSALVRRVWDVDPIACGTRNDWAKVFGCWRAEKFEPTCAGNMAPMNLQSRRVQGPEACESRRKPGATECEGSPSCLVKLISFLGEIVWFANVCVFGNQWMVFAVLQQKSEKKVR